MAILARNQFSCVDEAGNILPGATVEVRIETSGTPLAALFSDRAGVTPMTNPFNADGSGFAAYYVAGGAYQVKVTSGAFSRTLRHVATGRAAEFDPEAFLAVAGGSVTGPIDIAVAGATPLTLRRTENDAVEREILSWQSGSGAGNKLSDRLVGGGTNNVVEWRRYLGATEIERLTIALRKVFVDFGIGSNILLAAAGYAELAEISTPANPTADKVRLYCRDNAGISQLFYRNSTGAETLIGAGLDLIASTTVGPAVATVDFSGIPAVYKRLILLFDGVSHNNVATAAGFSFQVSDDGGATFETVVSKALNLITTTLTGVALSNSTTTGLIAAAVANTVTDFTGAIVIHASNLAAAAKPLTAWGVTGTADSWRHVEGFVTNASNAINFLRVLPSAGQIDAGNFRLYGEQ
jgi:hypothetical protein